MPEAKGLGFLPRLWCGASCLLFSVLLLYVVSIPFPPTQEITQIQPSERTDRESEREKGGKGREERMKERREKRGEEEERERFKQSTSERPAI